MKFSLMTFNIRIDAGTDTDNSWDLRSQRISELITSEAPLIVGIQEGSYAMLNDLKENMKHYNYIGEGRSGGIEGEFCAIFYKPNVLRITDKGQFWLSEQPETPNSVSWGSRFPRICTWGHFQSTQHPEIEFIVYNTHLDHVSDEAKVNGMALICRTIEEHRAEKGLPVILMGDLNSFPNSRVIQLLNGEAGVAQDTDHLIDSFTVFQGLPGCTYHNFEGGVAGAPIDYIYVSSNINLIHTKVERRKIGQGFPSDHYPVMTQIELES